MPSVHTLDAKERLMRIIDSLPEHDLEMLTWFAETLPARDPDGAIELDEELRGRWQEVRDTQRNLANRPSSPPMLGDDDALLSATHISNLVRAGHVPDDMRPLVADLLEGKRVRPAGRKRPALAAVFRQAYLAFLVIRVKRRLEWRAKQGLNHVIDTYIEAKELVGARYRVSPDRLDKWVYPRSDHPYRTFLDGMVQTLGRPTGPFLRKGFRQECRQARSRE